MEGHEDAEFEELQRGILGATEEMLGKRWIGGMRKIHKPWWNEEVREALRKKTRMVRKWLIHRTIQIRASHVEARNKAELVK